jgi:hypothetical protein
MRFAGYLKILIICGISGGPRRPGILQRELTGRKMSIVR